MVAPDSIPAPETQIRHTLSVLGEFLHPETNPVFRLDTILFIGLIGVALKLPTVQSAPWAWVAAFIFLYASASLFISFFGDTFGMRRHIFPSVEFFRLFAWIFIFPLMDASMETHRSEDSAPAK